MGIQSRQKVGTVPTVLLWLFREKVDIFDAAKHILLDSFTQVVPATSWYTHTATIVITETLLGGASQISKWFITQVKLYVTNLTGL